MRFKRNFLGLLSIVLIPAASIAWMADALWGDGDYYYEVKKGLRLFGDIYKHVTEKYVDEITPHGFIRAGIDGLLQDLDPYTIYYEGEESSELDLLMQGKYGGIGVSIGVKDGYLTVISTADQSPGHRAGILPGDRILSVDGFTSHDLNYQELSNMVRGEPGTLVRLTISRPGLERTLEFELVREMVHVENITYHAVLEGGVGYIKLTKFAKDADAEFAAALKELERQGMKSLVIDIRGNPGGLLEVAIDIANHFIRRGETITFTRGRTAESNRIYKATRDPGYEKLPVAVLVDEGSASASEILSGALQDLDRAIIVGSPTFGKGLVQTIYPLQERNSVLKITTAKYYTPSGRSIQKPGYRQSKPRRVQSRDTENDTFGDGDGTIRDDQTDREDSASFRTLSGRRVFAHGGIQPDIVVKNNPISPYFAEILRRGIIFDFATHFVARHSRIDSLFEMQEQDMTALRKLVDSSGFHFISSVEKSLDGLDSLTRTAGFPDEFEQNLEELRAIAVDERKKEFEKNYVLIKRTAEQEIISRFYGNRGRIAASLRNDIVLASATKVLSDQLRYDAILAGR